MTTLQLADNIFPQLQLKDSVGDALLRMEEFKISHLPVVAEDNFLGVIGEEVLQEFDEAARIETLQSHFIIAAVKADAHFLRAASLYNLYQVSMVPVVNDNQEYMGNISAQAILKATGNFCGAAEYGALVVIEMDRNRFALSEINSIIESDGATIMHMNVSPAAMPQAIEVTIQINKKEISTIIATLERYEYNVSFYSGEDLVEEELNNNYQHLMNYLDI